MDEQQPTAAPVVAMTNAPLEIQKGAFFRPYHIDRIVRIYPIEEGELNTLSILNTLSAICFSISSFFGSLALSLFTNLLTTPAFPSQATIEHVLESVFTLLTFIPLGIGIWALVAKKSEINRIKNQSVSYRPSGGYLPRNSQREDDATGSSHAILALFPAHSVAVPASTKAV